MSMQLPQFFTDNLQYQQDEVLQSFVDDLNKQFKHSIKSIIFYGSCMRTHEYHDAMLDFYVIVDEYSNAYTNNWHRIANRLLPPNVFFIQTEINGKKYRAKYAVITYSALLDGVSNAFHSYFWARFAQPICYIYTCDDSTKQKIVDVQCNAAKSFYRALIANFENMPTASDFWIEGLKLTYRAELRAETKTRAAHIYESDKDFYDKIFSILISQENNSNHASSINLFKWKIRIFYGKVLSILRLMKATTTFVGGVDYIAWKITRHTGEEVVVSENMRRWPWLYCWPVIFKLLKQGKIR